jgi:hypothetical protein
VWGERGAEERRWEACAAKERRREASTKVFLLSDGADLPRNQSTNSQSRGGLVQGWLTPLLAAVEPDLCDGGTTARGISAGLEPPAKGFGVSGGAVAESGSRRREGGRSSAAARQESGESPAITRRRPPPPLSQILSLQPSGAGSSGKVACARGGYTRGARGASNNACGAAARRAAQGDTRGGSQGARRPVLLLRIGRCGGCCIFLLQNA